MHALKVVLAICNCYSTKSSSGYTADNNILKNLSANYQVSNSHIRLPSVFKFLINIKFLQEAEYYAGSSTDPDKVFSTLKNI